MTKGEQDQKNIQKWTQCDTESDAQEAADVKSSSAIAIKKPLSDGAFDNSSASAHP